MELLSNTEYKTNKNSGNGSRFNTEVYDTIMQFLKDRGRSSKNTSKAYEKDIRYFFNKTRNKDIEHLQEEDLIFTHKELESFQSHIIDELDLSHSTSNRYITSISECFKRLSSRGLVKDINFLTIERPKAKANSYDHLTMDEIDYVTNEILKMGRESTAKIKAALINYSFDTCSRLEECLNLTWDNFTVIENEQTVKVRTVAKGNKVMNREISLDEYNKLLEIKSEKTNFVFNISESTVTRMMKDIRKLLNINEKERRIVFHSFRKAGAQFIWENTRDINQTRLALGHESIQTTEIYINKNEYYGVMGARSSASGLDEKLYEKVSHSELLTVIDKLSYDKKLFINLKIREHINNN